MKKYVINLEKVDEKMAIPDKTDNMGGQPIYKPPYTPRGYFLMEIFNDERKNWKDGVLCWQFYQDDVFGGSIGEIIEIPIEDAKLNVDKNIKKRRWMHKYIINYTEEEEESADFDNCESKWGGIPTMIDESEFQDGEFEYLGELFTNSLCANIDTGYGLETVVKDKDGNLQIIFG